MGHSKEALAVTERDVRLYVDKAKNWKRKKKEKKIFRGNVFFKSCIHIKDIHSNINIYVYTYIYLTYSEKIAPSFAC